MLTLEDGVSMRDDIFMTTGTNNMYIQLKALVGIFNMLYRLEVVEVIGSARIWHSRQVNMLLDFDTRWSRNEK